MKRTKYLLTAVALITAILLMACGCDADSAGDNTEPSQTAQKEAVQETSDNEAVDNEPTEIKTFRYVTVDWGTGSKDQDVVIQAVNDKLLADGMDFQLQMDGLPFDSWEQKTNLMITTNEPFDNLLVMNDVIPLSSYLARNAVTPISGYLDEYGFQLKEVIAESSWRSATKDGEIWAIPGNGCAIASVNEWLTIRKDWIEADYGKIPTTPEELIESAQAVYDAHPDTNPLAWPKTLIDNDYLHRSYEAYPFTVIDELIYVGQDGIVKSWVDTDEFKMDCDFWNTMMEKGLVNPDILTLDDSVRHEKYKWRNRLFMDNGYIFRQC